MTPFYSYLIPIIPIAGVAIVVFFIVAIVQEGKQQAHGAVIRSVFNYIVALAMLGIVIGSGTFLLNLGFKSWVFTKADAVQRYNPPPTLFLSANMTKETPTSYACADKCEFTQEDRTSFASWKEQYQSWKDNTGNLPAQRQRDAVGGFSFLIVSLPLFYFFYRNLQKEAKERAVSGPIRPLYFYGFALTGLLMTIISGAFLINLVLKTWVFTKAGDLTDAYYSGPVAMSTMDKQGVESVKNCGTACGFSDEDQALAAAWLDEYDAYQTGLQNKTNRTHSELATELPFILFGLPLFYYHWMRIRRESRPKNDSNPPDQIKLASS